LFPLIPAFLENIFSERARVIVGSGLNGPDGQRGQQTPLLLADVVRFRSLDQLKKKRNEFRVPPQGGLSASVGFRRIASLARRRGFAGSSGNRNFI
jgi:hypothetical protein